MALILASGGSAYLLARRMRFVLGTTAGLISVLILWQAIEIVSVQVAATLRMLGWIDRVGVSAIAKFEMLVLAMLAFWHFASTPADPPTRGSKANAKPPWPAYIWFAAAVLLGSYLAFALDVFTAFPSGSDSLIYHLPLAVRWLQDGSLAIPASRAWQESMQRMQRLE